MILRVYRVNDSLPECLIHDSLECNCLWDIDPGIYKKIETLEVNYKKVEDLIQALETAPEEIYDFRVSDIVEMVYDEEMLNSHDTESIDCNFLVYTSMEWKRVAIDAESVFRELSLRELYELFEHKNRV